MIRALDRLLAFFLITVLLFVIPTYYHYQRQEDIQFETIRLETQKVADLICEVGYLEQDSLAGLRGVLAATGISCRIRLTHLKKNFKQEDGQLVAYYEGFYNHEIETAIRKDGKYRMDLGDFFYLSVENQSQTPFQKVQAAFGISGPQIVIFARSGGLVRAEGL